LPSATAARSAAIYDLRECQVKDGEIAFSAPNRALFGSRGAFKWGKKPGLVFQPRRESRASRTKSLEPMRAILDIVDIVLNLYVWLLIAAAILSWLIAFNVVNTRNQFVASVAEFLYRITEPLLRPIRNILPDLGGLDISPVILIFIIMLIQRIIVYYIYPNVF
jgi:YggT family protein